MRTSDEVLEEILDRVIRIETRLTRLVEHFGLDPYVNRERKPPRIEREKIQG